MASKILHKILNTNLKHEANDKRNYFHTNNKHIQKQFVYDGKIATLLRNLNEADMAFSFNVQYKGQAQGKEAPLNGKATKLIMFNESGSHIVPVGSTLYRDDRATWHIKQ